jgi:hypothetical protein
MQRIPVKLARPGMVLAKPLLRDNGMVLLAEGTELSDSAVARLAGMGVDSIVVQGHPVDLEGLAGGTSHAARAARMDHLFRRHGDDPWMMQLKKVFKGYFTMKAAAQAEAERAEREAREAAARAEREARDAALRETPGAAPASAPGTGGR